MMPSRLVGVTYAHAELRPLQRRLSERTFRLKTSTASRMVRTCLTLAVSTLEASTARLSEGTHPPRSWSKGSSSCWLHFASTLRFQEGASNAPEKLTTWIRCQ
jgi:hypothetical protein